MIDLDREDNDIEWCLAHAPNASLNAYAVFLEAQVLSSYEHLAAVFAVTVDDIGAYRTIIERGRRIGEHEYFTKLKTRVAADDREAIKIYAEMLKIFNMDKEAPVTPEEQMTPEKVLETLRK